MKVPTYYQNQLEKALQAAKSTEPITFAGMFDSGVDYLFNLAVPLLKAELPKKITPVFIDLSGLTTEKAINSELSFILNHTFAGIKSQPDYLDIAAQVRSLSAKTKIVFVVYLGQEGMVDQKFFLLLNRLRNLLGWNFSYVLFLTNRLLLSSKYSGPLIDKVLKRNISLIQPLDDDNSKTVADNYQKRYQEKLSKAVLQKVVTQSGGNPGLIKALYLQAAADSKWKKPDILDERLFFRLRGIAKDLPEPFVKALLNPKGSADKNQYLESLVRYGYLKKHSPSYRNFSPLLEEYLKKHIRSIPHTLEKSNTDKVILHFSKSQRKVLKHLKQNSGKIVTKDDIAQVIWGKNWEDRYSDWAIDQLMHTLREKMTTSQIPGKIITKKGEGVILVTQK